MKTLFKEKWISSCQESDTLRGPPEIGTASWWHVHPYIRSGPEYSAVPGGTVLPRIRLKFGYKWSVNLFQYSHTDSCPKAAPAIRPVTMETRCFHKKLEFQRYPPKDLCTARYERKSSKKNFQTFQKPRKKQFLSRSWAKIGLRKTQPNVCSKRRDSESWRDIDRQNQRLRHEIWTGRAR